MARQAGRPGPGAERDTPEPRLRGAGRSTPRCVPVVYTDEAVERAQEQLLGVDAALVWVDPISDGQDRSLLDPMLRDVASRGVVVSAHPDVILKMGTKEVLVQTRDMGWGSECFLYKSLDEMRDQLPELLAQGPRVLKQHRGNDGNGVWKVELAGNGSQVHLREAQRLSRVLEITLDEALDKFAPYFDNDGCIIDQPYQDLTRGMVRCYLVQDRVAGFGQQYVTAVSR